ncbi:DUF5072 family protein [Garciella nitratireducens]|uniref:DUF5072 domain-containing protein n=1 Tax=Garciella nitratireducens DSM 15102 TaxID=1121911 RepID=A0A1T4K6A6_9FIRM|nr:DUF5072 family protein [Garciella nitratireducens]SJZ37942.1 protein of unknown function [Garciella nitratireducens DSM 15102]
MIKKLSFIEVLEGIINLIELKTGKRCYDDIPINANLPFYFAEIIGQEPDPSKTMWKEKYYVNIHAFSEGGSSIHIYNTIQELEEAMTESITIKENYELIRQHPTGLQRILTEEDNIKHAVLGYEFLIMYGYKTKL